MRWNWFLTCALIAAMFHVNVASVQAGDESSVAIRFDANDWPWWRGPTRDGIAASGQAAPTTWSQSENVVWKAQLPGRGHGSPTVVGNRIFLATAELDKQTQSVICLDRSSGKHLWLTVVHEGGLDKKGNEKASLASSSVACDGQAIYISFFNQGAIFLSSLTLDGKLLWQKRLTDFAVHQGFGSSPSLLGSMVFVTADSRKTGQVFGLNRSNGETVWSSPRPELPNYTSPIILKAAGREQMVVVGCKLVTSYDPETGKKLWEIDGATEECVASTVTDGKVVFSSGGYPRDHLAAIAADGSGKVVWENKSRIYVPSMICINGYLYASLDAGIAACWRTSDGQEMWKQRLGGTFSASLVAAGGNIYATNEEGDTYVFRASAERYEQVAKNHLGESVFATPSICGGRVYHRVAHASDAGRQEFLYCLGKD